MAQCGVPNVPVFGNETPQQRIASQLFMDSFDTALTITTDEVGDALTAFTKLPAANGRITLQPGVKRRILAFVQWTRSMLRTGRDPTLRAFPVANMLNILKDLQTCKRFEKQSDLLATQAKPKKFTADTQWADWEPTLVNYLKLIPGITGIPLAYVVRRTAIPPAIPIVGPVLDTYIENAPLMGEVFTSDAQSVNTLILTFITEYPEVESIVRTATQDDGRMAYLSMVSRFEGVGALSVELLEAEKVIKDLFYSGEKPPTMYWEKFEKDLKYSYAIIDRRAGQIVHDDESKLRSLVNERIRADFLKTTNSVLKIQLETVPLALTFQGALDSLRNEVNTYNRNNGVSRFRNARQQRNVSSTEVQGRTKKRTDSTWEKLTNGEIIEYHPSFRFGNKLQHFPKALKDKLQKQRSDYKNKNKRKSSARGDGKRSVKQVKKEVEKLGELVGLIHASQGGSDKAVNISEANSNPMGGRNSRQVKNETDNLNLRVMEEVATKIAKLKSELDISSLTISVKESSTTYKQIKEHPPGTTGMNEADTNAECGVAGRNMIPLSYTTRSADVFGFLPSKGAVEDVPIVTAATAYTCTKTGLTFILLFHEFL